MISKEMGFEVRVKYEFEFYAQIKTYPELHHFLRQFDLPLSHKMYMSQEEILKSV